MLMYIGLAFGITVLEMEHNGYARWCMIVFSAVLIDYFNFWIDMAQITLLPFQSSSPLNTCTDMSVTIMDDVDLIVIQPMPF